MKTFKTSEHRRKIVHRSREKNKHKYVDQKKASDKAYYLPDMLPDIYPGWDTPLVKRVYSESDEGGSGPSNEEGWGD